MNDYKAEVNKIIRTARNRSDGDVALLEHAARLADLHADTRLGLNVRIRLIDAANWSGNYELLLAAFSWCLAQLDRDEQLRIESERKVLWYYKWVVESLCEYSQVSKQQIDRSFADMTDRYTRAGYGMGPLHKCRAYATIRLGDLASHRQARAQWAQAPREDISDCRACQTNSAVEFDVEAGDLAGAVKTAEPILQGLQRCTEVPCLTAGLLLLPLLRLGSKELAESLHLANLRQTLSTRDFLNTIGSHIAYLALTNRTTRALALFETGISWFGVTRRTWDRMLFVEHAAVLFDVLARGSDDPLMIKVPENVRFHRDDDRYRPSAVAQALAVIYQEFAVEFNLRNGNDYLFHRHADFQRLVAGCM